MNGSYKYLTYNKASIAFHLIDKQHIYIMFHACVNCFHNLGVTAHSLLFIYLYDVIMLQGDAKADGKKAKKNGKKPAISDAIQLLHSKTIGSDVRGKRLLSIFYSMPPSKLYL